LNVNGRIDQVTDLETMDLIAFNDGVNPWSNGNMSVGFKSGREFLRGKVQEWGFQGLGRVIDVGSGYGRWSMFLAEQNNEFVGIERNEEGVAFTSKLSDYLELNNSKFHAGDVSDIPEESESFDGVWCNNVVQFVDRGAMFTEINRILKKDGIFFLGVANSAGRVLEKFFTAYAQGGLEHRTSQFALNALKQGPLYNGRGGYTTPETIEEVMDKFGFERCEDYPISAKCRKGAPLEHSFEEELKDLSKLATRLLEDEKFAAEFAQFPELANCFPLNVDIRTRKVRNL